MVRPVAYDITRLATRVLNRTPNGIDRIDFAFAEHFVELAQPKRAAVMMTALGARVFAPAAAYDIIKGISSHWGEDDSPGEDESFRRIVAWIGDETLKFSTAERIARGRTGRTSGVLRWISQHGFPLGQPPVTALPEGAVYLNVSQFPLWIGNYFRWMKRRPDIKPVFFIHDLLPIETPEYFRKGEFARHHRRIENLARLGAAAIVTTHAVRSALEVQLARLGRTGMPVLVAPIPAAPIFSHREGPDPDLLKHPYFVVCGTIEPRKNHLLLLHVWRELVRRDGATAPKLVMIGTRGWENENVVDLLERCREISNHVIEVSGLSTPSLKHLLDGACALLMPSFAEGYGLPVAEALAAGVPVIASDLPVFRETCGERITAISPIDGEKWLETVRAFARTGPAGSRAALAGCKRPDLPGWSSYFAKVESFLASL
jgi:glycosyltransferase involved in cell wall biosynthesis